ncbi:MAG TPA: hypothetical protein VHE54_01195 [Puia sp.]|nr:hypothetical protein [Puia sp.]
MADTTNDSTTISTTSSPFQSWLDFGKLRSESIKYLAQLTGNIWTDYNAHDPGITILEMLCYAVMDLGYRASLPIGQVLAPAPDVPGPDTNFFTPARILACNPLTIADYRRLLIDLEGVTNAWIEVATDQHDICREQAGRGGCETFLNGLYTVQLQLDENVTTTEQRDAAVARVKKTLMAHRNFCEDFLDIKILCTMGIGVCADIELEIGADVNTVFPAIVTAIQGFFSTAPKFYTLQELLQPPKSKPIESIFAGRPYDITQSHGFVDPDEFERIRLRREIHLSDLYSVILQVGGVKTIRRLALQVCGNNPVSAGDSWVFHVPKDYVPIFNLSCCGWQFSQNNRSVRVDVAALSAPFNINYAGTAKLLYPQGSPYLDLAIEYGAYLPGLGDYYSIQNEFPRVYGIGPGGLPGDASDQRKAQALQLKGYLLFFDQVLADYVAQLSNIRSLFSLTTPPASGQHTYFTSQLASVPGIDKLIATSSTATATAIAVSAEVLGESTITHLPKPYPFDTVDERNTAVWQFVDDAATGNLTIGTLAVGSCFYFYIKGSFCGVILVGRSGYDKEQHALDAGSLLLSQASQKSNYSLFNLADGAHFSFHVGVDIPGYYAYLQTIAEDAALYRRRRGQFLDHLLARFAEQFTDLAILSYGSLKDSALDDALIAAKERFLGDYAGLSSNRGKAADYSVNGWYNDNVSGFEQRVAGLAGMNAGGNHSLCNFVVEQREDRYIIRVVIDGQLLFTADEKLYSREATCHSARELFRCAADFDNYRVAYDDTLSRFGVKLYYQNKEAWCSPRFDSHGAAMEHARDVHALFAATRCETVVSQYVHRIVITDHAGAEVATYKDVYGTEEEARRFLADAAHAHFPNIYVYGAAQGSGGGPGSSGEAESGEQPGSGGGRTEFVNLDGFRFIPDDAIEDKVGKLTYRLVDDVLRFRLQASAEFDSLATAKEDYYRLIRLLGHRANIVPVYDKRMEAYQLRVIDGSEVVAFTPTFYSTLTDANARAEYIHQYTRRHLFQMLTPKRPYRWKYAFELAFAPYGRYSLRSVAEYPSPELAIEASEDVDTRLDACDPGGFESSPPIDSSSPLLQLRRDVRRLAAAADEAAFNPFVQNETLDKELKYIYRLVDKDHLHGIYLPDDYGNDSAGACAKKKALFQQQPPYGTIDFCLGGDIVRQRVEPESCIAYYHFQLKLTRCSDPALNGLVLFESVQGYASAAAAEAAFDGLYMVILRKALDPSQYGADRYIGIKEVFIDTIGECVKLRSVVFIPDETKKFFSWYDIDQLIARLVAIVRLYPMRSITDAKADRQEFKRRFPCFTLPPLTDDRCSCPAAPVIGQYYFYVLSDTAGNEIWQSAWPIADLQKARCAFEFFLLLLRYPGNYVVERDPCTCRWSIYIREVLAESTRRFSTKAEAWGPEGIEKFICVAQTPGAFHLYRNRKTCCDSYYVACPRPQLIHPCHYDTPENRDKALAKLFRSFADFSTRNLADLFFPHETNFIYDLQGQPVAIFDNMDVERDFALYCCRLLELVNTIFHSASFERTAEGCVMRNDLGHVIAHAADPGIGLDEWRKRLQQLAYYFPIVREKEAGDKDRFCIEIRLPCFNDPDDDLVDDCGCGGWKGKPGTGCWVAWKSSCCYETCQKAFTDYFMLLAVLADKRNYRPIDDCPCGDYRIVLHAPEDIVAFNPQCYSTPAMDCDAAARARALINAEGLHTVEHILLRPRVPEDCRCEALTERCPDLTDCHFTWSPPVAGDPCEVDKEICFDPGADPYSFIATVALPAWPQRFRSKENRAYIEYMLAREAPAHVLLRVLWLAPHDLCCFEVHYRQWLRWLACKPVCRDGGYTPCAFVKFLFHTRLECLGECHECPPCVKPAPSPCFTEKDEQLHPIGKNTLLDQIDELYCWAPMTCDGRYEWAPCEVCEECGCEEKEEVAGVVAAGPGEPVAVASPEAVAAAEPVARIEQVAVASPEAQAPGEPVVVAAVEPAAPAAAEPAAPAPPDDRERRRFINARYADHKHRRDVLEKEAGDNEILEKAKKFLAAREPTVERFSKLMDQVLEEKGGWKMELAAIIAAHFLDLVVLRDLRVERPPIKAVFDRMRKAGVDTKALFASWSAGLQPQYGGAQEIAAIRRLAEGKR